MLRFSSSSALSAQGNRASFDGRGFLHTEAPQGRHFCQLHHGSRTLDDALAVFAASGLARDEAVIVIAAHARNTALREQLAAASMDIAGLRAAGRLILLDEAAVQRCFMRDGMPQWQEFRETLGIVIGTVRAKGRRAIRIYGEIVSELWRAGNTAAAIRLEEHWNAFAREERFALFCGYQLDGMDEQLYAGPLDAIAREHTDMPAVAGDERFLAAIDAASRDVLGMPLSELVSSSGATMRGGEHRLPIAHRTLWWLRKNMPSALTKILRRARHYHGAAR